MIFFSEFNKNYKLIKVHNYKEDKIYTEKALFLDPGVYELTKGNDYSQIERMYRLLDEGLPSNVFMSIDYPPDMNTELTDIFIELTHTNNVRYKDDPQYICTPQYKMNDFDSFYEQFERTRHIWEQPFKIIGLGNICRLFPKKYFSEFMNKVLSYIVDNMTGRWVHVYGCPKWIIREWKYVLAQHKIKFSVDSTKWTMANSKHLRDEKNGYMCLKANRRKFYEDYTRSL